MPFSSLSSSRDTQFVP